MLTLWNGFDRNFGRALAQHQRLFNDSQTRPGLSAGWPRVEIAETPEALEVKAEVPGFAADDITINLHEGILTLEGKMSSEQEQQTAERKVLFSERRELSFTRTFRVGRDLDADNINANLKDGLLTVVLPKAEAVKPRQIAITAT
jgi:HSP20 family protein